MVNPGCEILFEDEEGELTDIFEDEVPYDLKADVIEIEDMDYGIFYVDMRDHPERYQGRTVKFKGMVLKSRDVGANFFVPGRMAMTCCADDTTFIGYVCQSKNAPQTSHGKLGGGDSHRRLEVSGCIPRGRAGAEGQSHPLRQSPGIGTGIL